MLSVYLGEMEQAIYYPPAYFDNQYEDEWITDKLSMEMIKDVDKSEVIGPHLIESPVLGPISVKEISGISWILDLVNLRLISLIQVILSIIWKILSCLQQTMCR